VENLLNSLVWETISGSVSNMQETWDWQLNSDVVLVDDNNDIDDVNDKGNDVPSWQVVNEISCNVSRTATDLMCPMK